MCVKRYFSTTHESQYSSLKIHSSTLFTHSDIFSNTLTSLPQFKKAFSFSFFTRHYPELHPADSFRINTDQILSIARLGLMEPKLYISPSRTAAAPTSYSRVHFSHSYQTLIWHFPYCSGIYYLRLRLGNYLTVRVKVSSIMLTYAISFNSVLVKIFFSMSRSSINIIA